MLAYQRVWTVSPAVILILVNLVPLIGVYFLNWNSLEVLFLYWSETAIIGFYTVLKIFLAQKKLKHQENQKKEIWIWPALDLLRFRMSLAELGKMGKLFITFAFIYYLSLFLFFHFFLLIFLSKELMPMLNIIEILRSVAITICLLFISHGISFLVNYLSKKEYQRSEPSKFIYAPFYRVFPMHVAIILGFYFNIPVLVLIITKVFFDLYGYSEERKPFNPE